MPSSFALHAEQTLEALFEYICEYDAISDLDADLIDGVLRIDFDNGAVVILNRQEPLKQLWLASPEGPAHFTYEMQREEWVDERTGESLSQSLSRIFSLQTGIPVTITCSG